MVMFWQLNVREGSPLDVFRRIDKDRSVRRWSLAASTRRRVRLLEFRLHGNQRIRIDGAVFEVRFHLEAIDEQGL
jgi:hypothetical protein